MKRTKEGYSGQRLQHIEGTGVFCKVERGALGGFLRLLRISEVCVGWARSGTELGWSGLGISLP